MVTLSPFVLPELRRGFEEANPLVNLSHVEAHQVDLFARLRRAEIDVAITYDLEMPQDLAFETLTELAPYVLFATDHPLAKRRAVSLETLEALPLVLLDLPLSREYFLSLFHNRGLRPSIAERTQNLMMVRSMVANGFGYSLLNIHSLNEHAPDGKALRYVPLESEERPMVMGLATVGTERKPRVLRAFEEHCRRCVRPDSVPGMAVRRRRRRRATHD